MPGSWACQVFITCGEEYGVREPRMLYFKVCSALTPKIESAPTVCMLVPFLLYTVTCIVYVRLRHPPYLILVPPQIVRIVSSLARISL